MSHQTTDEQVTDVVRILLAYKRQKQDDVITSTGIPKRTLIRRMNAGGWSAAEVADLAQHFQVPVSVFYEGPDSLLAGVSGRSG